MVELWSKVDTISGCFLGRYIRFIGLKSFQFSDVRKWKWKQDVESINTKNRKSKIKIGTMVIVFLSGFCGHIYNVGVEKNLWGVYN